jgi:cyclopropane-fatty-acyl-phospholipid synthase
MTLDHSPATGRAPRPGPVDAGPVDAGTSGPEQARVAADRLPSLEPLRGGPRTAVSAAVARTLFRAAVRRLAVTVVEEPSGLTFGQGGPVMRVHRPEEFYARLGRDGLIGFGESYLTGAWDAQDVAGFLTVPAARMATLVPASLQRLRALVTHRTPSHQVGTEDNSQDNISHHYDLSNDLFALFLDETLSYSSALFDTSQVPAIDTAGSGEAGPVLVAAPPEAAVTTDTVAAARELAEAQARKIDRLLDEAGVSEGSRVLEIGTGWGELAIRAARRGATVHTITLSVEQLELAERRVAEAGLSDRVRIDLMDYRALGADGATYDAVVSVEMIEAVGHEFWGTYFRTIDRVLAPGGRVAVQAITMPHDRMLATRGTHTWITKYIFPGGFLPSTEVIDQVTRDETDLRLTGRLSMGSHYAETLRRWDEAFLARREEVLSLGFDDLFMRIWHFYLAYSRAGFASGYIDVQQLTFSRETR